MNMQNKQNDNLRFFANCGLGFEKLVAHEIETCGGKDIESGPGVVFWQGGLESGYRACLWSRMASRVLIVLAHFSVQSEEDLYNFSKSYDWTQHMDCNSSFAIDCSLSGDATVTHSQFASLRVKDGLVDYFRESVGDRPSVETEQPNVRFHVHVAGDQGSLALDISGESLHKRGYRVVGGLAPMKETLAAGIVALAGWLEKGGERPNLVDPMCGTGTLLIEAAMLYGDIAPGISRDYFGFMGWKGHDKALWDSLIDEAVAREDAGFDKKWPLIKGYDADPVVVAAARKNIMRAGLEPYIQVKCQELVHLRPPTKGGMILCNLPYGERLSETERVRQLYSCLGRIGHERFVGWNLAVFISNPDLTESFNVSWADKFRLYNGSIACRLLVGPLTGEAETSFVWEVKDTEVQPEAADFANRFRKNLKKYLKWARKENISCFRVYDRDLPEYNLSVDLYGKWVHVQEYLPPKTIDPEIASKRFDIALRAIKDILGLRSDRVFIKKRQRQQGKKQYQKHDNKKKFYQVQEGDARVLVNFRDYLDTGLFLDHRPMRLRIAEEAQGKRFLNLFGYTGTASVHAAVGGAASTTTVDLSRTYLDWTMMNLSLNGFAEQNHKTVKSDCLQWLTKEKDLYDLIFVDPPTFSNTKKDDRVFDVQRDHIVLVRGAMARLAEGGVLYFSTNFRRFELDKKLAETYEINNITKSTIPLDFERNSKIHYCWEIRHK